MHTRNVQRNLTFTFTFICHLGKTHHHRYGEDTAWRAQTQVKSSHYINNRQPNGSLSNVLSRLA